MVVNTNKETFGLYGVLYCAYLRGLVIRHFVAFVNFVFKCVLTYGV